MWQIVGIWYPFCGVLDMYVTVVVGLQRIVLNRNDKKVALIATHPQADDRIEKKRLNEREN